MKDKVHFEIKKLCPVCGVKNEFNWENMKEPVICLRCKTKLWVRQIKSGYRIVRVDPAELDEFIELQKKNPDIIRLVCPKCKEKITYLDKYTKKPVDCPHCGIETIIQVFNRQGSKPRFRSAVCKPEFLKKKKKEDVEEIKRRVNLHHERMMKIDWFEIRGKIASHEYQGFIKNRI